MQLNCSICGTQLDDPEFASSYPNFVCRQCGERAVNEDGLSPHHNTLIDYGDNPLFIDGIKCWRRYKFGGYITMRDAHDCATLEEFNAKNGVGKQT